MDTFTRAYLTAALFTEHDDPSPGEFEEHGDWTIANFAPEALESAVKDCARFQEIAGALIEDDIEHAGRDFWFTRNGHGCGFWDGDWPDADADVLTEAAKHFGEADLYRGDDGLLYFTR